MTDEVSSSVENSPWTFLKRRVEWLIARFLYYMAFFLFVAGVSIGALLVDNAILLVVKWTVADSISKYSIVSVAFDWFQIGTAFLAFIGAGMHAFFSFFSQAKFEIKNLNEPDLT